MVYFGLHHVCHPDRTFLANFDPFGPSCERIVDGMITANNAEGKRMLLGSSALYIFPFVSTGYRELLANLLKLFHAYHSLGGLSGDRTQQYEDARQQLLDPDWWIGTLQHALDAGAWVENDIVDDIFPPLSTVLQRRQLDATASLLFDTSHIDKTTGRPHASTGMSLDPPASHPAPQLAFSLPASRDVRMNSQQNNYLHDQSTAMTSERKINMRMIKKKPKREGTESALNDLDPPAAKKPRIE